MAIGNLGFNSAKVDSFDCTIASGTTSAEIDLKGSTTCGIETPSGLSSTLITLKRANDSGGTFNAVKDVTDTLISITVNSGSDYYALQPSDMAGIRFVKIETGSSETNKTFKIVVRGLE